MTETILPPAAIAPNLQCGILIGDTWVTIDYADRQPGNGRTRYVWTILLDGADVSGDDLYSGAQGGDLMQGLESLLSFLSAAGEAYRYEMSGRKSDNSGLFPANVTEWAYQNSDELGMAAYELAQAIEERE